MTSDFWTGLRNRQMTYMIQILQDRPAHCTSSSVLTRILGKEQKLSIFLCFQVCKQHVIPKLNLKGTVCKKVRLEWRKLRLLHWTWFESRYWGNLCQELLYCDLLRSRSFISCPSRHSWQFVFLHVGNVRLGSKGWKDPGSSPLPTFLPSISFFW